MLTQQEAQSILERSRAWGPIPARELDQHFAEHGDALTAPSPHSPVSLVRLLRQLESAGYGDAVTQAVCAKCGRSDRPLPRPTPQGRCCNWCVDRTELRQCARCGQDGRLVRRVEEGPICRSCYRNDPSLSSKQCAACGQLRTPAIRREDGTVLCSPCAPRPDRNCVRCGNLRPTQANTEEGPLCKSCYEPPPRPCGGCGNVRQIAVRAADGQPDLCASCHTGPVGECVVCGRHRRGSRVRERGDAFHCKTCRPRVGVRPELPGCVRINVPSCRGVEGVA